MLIFKKINNQFIPQNLEAKLMCDNNRRISEEKLEELKKNQKIQILTPKSSKEFNSKHFNIENIDNIWIGTFQAPESTTFKVHTKNHKDCLTALLLKVEEYLCN